MLVAYREGEFWPKFYIMGVFLLNKLNVSLGIPRRWYATWNTDKIGSSPPPQASDRQHSQTFSRSSKRWTHRCYDIVEKPERRFVQQFVSQRGLLHNLAQGVLGFLRHFFIHDSEAFGTKPDRERLPNDSLNAAWHFASVYRLSSAVQRAWSRKMHDFLGVCVPCWRNSIPECFVFPVSSWRPTTRCPRQSALSSQIPWPDRARTLNVSVWRFGTSASWDPLVWFCFHQIVHAAKFFSTKSGRKVFVCLFVFFLFFFFFSFLVKCTRNEKTLPAKKQITLSGR